MPKKSNTIKDRECTEECQSTQHATELISAITLPITCINDQQLVSYFKSKCLNFAKIRDRHGRTLLHTAASCGRKNLCLYLLKMYAQNINFADTESGYTALHRSIAYGFINVAVALIQMNADLNAKDNEDYSPLDILLRNVDSAAVENILFSRFPKSSKSNDVEVKTSKKPNKKSKADYSEFILFSHQKLNALNRVCCAFATEVYTWGTNLNYTSGFGSASGKSQPEFLEFFEKKNEIILEIVMQKFHTLFVSMSGNVWSCGIGQGGRLGLSSEKIVLIPELVSLKSPVAVQDAFFITAAAGQDHSIFLCNENKVFVCGTNTYHQLGINPPPACVIKPVLVNLNLDGQQILGVAASDFHSVLWTGSAVFTCGLHAGQLGHLYSEDITISTFRKARCIRHLSGVILNVTAGRAVTLILDESYVHILTNYACLKIDLVFILRSIDDKEMERNHRNCRNINRVDKEILYRYRRVLKLATIGGELNSEKIKPFPISSTIEELQIVIVLHDGSLYLWKKKTERLSRCFFLAKFDILVTDVVLNANVMLISTRKGEVFRAKPLEMINFSLQPSDDFHYTSNYANFLESMRSCYILRVEKIESIFRAVSIFSDPKGDNFAVLQHRSAGALVPIPVTSENSLKIDLIKFYHETDESDVFHDIIFKVKQKSFAAHKYILASCSEKFLEFQENNDTIIIDDMSPEVFEVILEFAYTGSIRVRMESVQNRGVENRNTFSRSLPFHEVMLKQILQAAETFKIHSLKNFLGKLRIDGFTINLASNYLINKEVISSPLLDRLRFSSLYDIKLKSQDGNIFHAHKCILVARVEYFKNMLSGYWIESTNMDHEFNMPVTSAVLSEVLEYLYTDKISKKTKKKDLQFWTSLLMMADQFILMKLKELAEKGISERLNVRNVVDTLIFACLVNAHQLKASCFRFICVNLSSILYFGFLDKLDDDLLDQLTEYYRNEFCDTSLRKFPDIPVYSEVCYTDEIFSVEPDPEDWDLLFDVNPEVGELVTKTEEAKPKKKFRKFRKPASTEINNSKITQSKLDLERKEISNYEFSEQITATKMEGSSVKEHQVVETEDWIAIHRQMKTIKSLLRANAAAKECPRILEQEENYVSLRFKTSPSDADPLTESGANHCELSPNDQNYSIDINFENLTPKLSQAERKRLRRLSESSKTKVGPSSPVNDNLDKPFTVLADNCVSPSSSPSLNCWKNLERTLEESTSFSSIIASEKKQKRSVLKETKKIETKSLHSTQIEEQAIQELMTFYNVKNIDDEHITVQRVVHKVNVPLWVTK